MRASVLVLTITICGCGFFDPAFDVALAQGTKDPSNPVPTMVFPIRPRDEPAPHPTAVPNHNKAFPPQPTIRLRRSYPYWVRVPR
jgi:hypothetical protein